MTPYLMLVLAGYTAFIVTLGVYWQRGYAAEIRERRR